MDRESDIEVVEHSARIAPGEDAPRTGERYRAIAETLRAVPWEGDPIADEVIYVGPQIEALTGYRVDQWTAIGWREAIHPDDREGCLRTYRRNLAIRRDHDLEYRVITTAGKVIWFRDIITFVTDPDG